MQVQFITSPLKKGLILGLGLALLSLPVSAGPTKSFTKNAAGLSFKLTIPHPLPMGEQKLRLKVMQGTQLLKKAKLTGLISMDDGMKAAVKITPQTNGEFELKTNFSMGGEWQIKLQQSAPVKTEVKFELMVSGGNHAGHQM